jgi:hypothetical protein
LRENIIIGGDGAGSFEEIFGSDLHNPHPKASAAAGGKKVDPFKRYEG